MVVMVMAVVVGEHNRRYNGVKGKRHTFLLATSHARPIGLLANG